MHVHLMLGSMVLNRTGFKTCLATPLKYYHPARTFVQQLACVDVVCVYDSLRSINDRWFLNQGFSTCQLQPYIIGGVLMVLTPS